MSFYWLYNYPSLTLILAHGYYKIAGFTRKSMIFCTNICIYQKKSVLLRRKRNSLDN